MNNKLIKVLTIRHPPQNTTKNILIKDLYNFFKI